eukprot:2617515-Pleurochrysis_carterae.AAC.1
MANVGEANGLGPDVQLGAEVAKALPLAARNSDSRRVGDAPDVRDVTKRGDEDVGYFAQQALKNESQDRAAKAAPRQHVRGGKSVVK